MAQAAARIGRGIDGLSRAGGVLGGAILVASAVAVCYEVIMRYAFNAPTIWSYDISIYLFIWFSFISLAYAQRENSHICVDFLIIKFSEHTRAVWNLMTLAFATVFTAYLSYYAIAFVEKAIRSHEVSVTILTTPMWIPKLAVALGSTMLLLQLVKDIVVSVKRLSGSTLKRGVSAWDRPRFIVPLYIVVVLLACYTYTVAPVAGFVLLLLLLLFGGLPIFAGLGLVGMMGMFLLFGGFPALASMPQIAYGKLNSFSLLCVPLFIFTGRLLETSGAGRELFDMCAKWVGHLPGGLAIATVFSCSIFAAISSSSVATAATIGLIALPALVAHRYNPKMSYGILAAGGTLGIMIPPSGSMILYSAMTEESLGKLFMAGVIPGIILSVGFALYAVIRCSRTGEYERAQVATWKERFLSIKDAIWALLTIIIIVGGIFSGMFTPMEAAGVSMAYSLVMALARKKISLRELPTVFGKGSQTAIMIIAIIIGAMIMGNFMTLLQLPQKAMALIEVLDPPAWGVIVVLMVIYLILGCFLEVNSILLITLPVVYPVVTALGFDGIWFAVLLTLNMEMCLLTPPVGLNLYVITGISGASVMDVAKGVLPFFLIMLACLLLFGLVPQLSTFLPSVMIR